ncbi:MAG: hypothetical protein ACSW8I_05640 [bacterium]
MKRSIFFVAMISLMTMAFAQNDNQSGSTGIFDIKHQWTKIVGYSYQPGYPYGFSLAGGSFMSVGFAEDGKQYNISATEYREPTWSMRFGWIGYNFDKDITGWGAISFRPMFVLGFNRTKDVTFDAASKTWSKESNTYFTMAPSLVVNVYMLHFSVGYEIVPKFKELNGLNFGIGISIPSNPEKWEQKAKAYQESKNNKNSKADAIRNKVDSVTKKK